MKHYGDIEDEIVSRLGQVLKPAGVDVFGSFNSINEYSTAAKARVVVTYIGSIAEENDVRTVQQMERATFEVLVQSKSLKAPTLGAYAIMTAVKQRLIGWRTSFSNELALTKIAIVMDEAGKSFGWAMHFNTELFNVADLEEEVLGILRQFTLNEPTIEAGQIIPDTPPVPPI